MIRVEMFMDEADNGYTFNFHAYNAQGTSDPPFDAIHRRVCVEGKDREAIFRLEGQVGDLLQDFFETVKQNIRSRARVGKE